MRRLSLAAGLTLALALAGATVRQADPTELEDRSNAVALKEGTVLVYLVADRKTDEILVGPYVIPMAELPVRAGHGCEEVFDHRISPEAADEVACTVRCRALRSREGLVDVYASVTMSGASYSGKTRLAVKGRGCDVVRLQGRDDGRFALVSAVCDPVCRAPATAGAATSSADTSDAPAPAAQDL